MAKKSYKPEEIVIKLIQVEVMQGQEMYGIRCHTPNWCKGSPSLNNI